MEKDNNQIQQKFYSLQFPFENKVFFYPRTVIYKGHKIFLAVYLATEHITNEPIIQEIRKSAVQFFSALFSSQPDILNNESSRLIALIESAAFLNMISQTNSSILCSEITSLLAKIAPTHSISPVSLNKEFFSVPEFKVQEPINFQKDIKDNKRHLEMSQNIYNNKEINIKDTTLQPSERTTKIINFLKEKGPTSIRDIRIVIRDVSEKTIQRELAILVDQGRVLRTGERRWSSYSLK